MSLNIGHEMYKHLPLPDDIVNCPVCSAQAELWSFSETPDSALKRVVCCSHNERIGRQDEGMQGCLLYMPPNDFYLPTAREAIRFWNEFANHLTALRHGRRRNARSA